MKMIIDNEYYTVVIEPKCSVETASEYTEVFRRVMLAIGFHPETMRDLLGEEE